MLTALVPSITISDIILARPLSLPPVPVEQSNQPRSRIAVPLSSASLVSEVLLARSDKIRISTDDPDISLLGSELSKHVKHCKIFIDEALRGGKFLARVREGDRVHVFESLSDL